MIHKRKSILIILFVAVLGIGFVFVGEANASFYPSGTLVSRNLLSEESGLGNVGRFGYHASSIPLGATLKVQFSQDGDNWYNSNNQKNEWDTLEEGDHLSSELAIDLSDLDWSGNQFYYKMIFESTSEGGSPVLDEISLHSKVVTHEVVGVNLSEPGIGSATVEGEITSVGEETIEERGFQYGETEDPTWDIRETGNFGTGSFNLEIPELNVDTKYYFRAFAVDNDNNYYYGGWSSFVIAGHLTFYPSGTLVSQNLLSGQDPSIIEKFGYNASLIPVNTGLKLQFSQDGDNWYNSNNLKNEWDILEQGNYLSSELAIDLSDLDWSGNEFYYKMRFESTEEGKTPVLDEVKLYYGQYASSGDYTSQVKDFGTSVNFTTFQWDADVPVETDLKFQIATSDDNETWSNFVGPDGELTSYYKSSGENIWSGHDGDRYLKWKAYLETGDTVKTPELKEVTVNTDVEYPVSHTLVGSWYDSTDPFNVIADINWQENTPSGTSVKFQLRTAPDDDGSPDEINETDWVGPDGTSETFFTDPEGGENMPDVISDPETGDNQWFQYKAFLETDSSSETPTLESVTVVYVVNAPPEFNPDYPEVGDGGVQGFQISDKEDQDWGKVRIKYSVLDPDTTEGTETPGYITPSFEYSLDEGGSWSEITGTYLNQGDLDKKSVQEEEYTIHEATWDVKNQEPNILEDVEVRVTVDDNELANNIATAVSPSFSVDTRDPEVSPIYNAQITHLSPTSVIMEWNTDKPTISQVQYGETDSLGEFSEWTESYEESASIFIDNLEAETKYYWEAISEDELGNETIDDNQGEKYSFTTPDFEKDTTEPEITNIEAKNITETSVEVTWDTDLDSNNFVEYGTTQDLGNLEGNVSASDTSHIVSLSDLEQDTKYYYKVMSADSEFGNLATSEMNNFTTEADVTPPEISNLDHPVVDRNSATITWDTSKPATSQVAYGLEDFSQGYASETTDQIADLREEHSVVVDDLSSETTYYYQAISEDEAGNEQKSNIKSFTTATAVEDPEDPEISNVEATNINQTSADIVWITDKPTNSIVDFGVTSDLGSLEGEFASTTEDHVVSLSDLDQDTEYHYRVRGIDEQGNSAESVVKTFTTEKDEVPPVIEEEEVSFITHDASVISWETDKLATSQVKWGKDTDLDQQTQETSFYTQEHSVFLTDLESETTYYYQVVSKDKAGNIAEGEKESFTTSEVETRGGIRRVEVIPEGYRDEEEMCEEMGLYWYNETCHEESEEVSLEEIQTEKECEEEGFYWYDETCHEEPEEVLVEEIQTEKECEEEGFYWYDEACHEEPEAPVDITEKEKQEILDFIKKGSQSFVESVLESVSLNPHLPDISEEDFVASVSEMAAKTVESPSISGPDISVETSPRSALVRWRTDKGANSLVAFSSQEDYDSEKEEPYLQERGDSQAHTTDHAVTLTGLEPNTTYHYQIRSRSPLGPVAEWEDRTFTTPSLAPEITDVNVNNIEERKITLSWETNLPTRSTVNITDDKTGEVFVQENPSFLRDHEFEVIDLEPGTAYTVQVKSEDEEGNTSLSSLLPVSTFLSKEPPVLSKVEVSTSLIPGSPQRVQAIFTWRTDKPSTSRVLYQEGRVEEEPRLSTPLSERLTTRHTIVTTALDPGTVYTFRVESMDALENRVLSGTYTVLTPQPEENIFDIIIGNFQQTFDFLF